MSGNYRYSGTSTRAIRRDRHKAPFKPANTGKPQNTRDAGTRTVK